MRGSPKGKALIFYQILPTNSLKKCMEISRENLHVDTGHKGSRRQGDGAFARKLLEILGGIGLS